MNRDELPTKDRKLLAFNSAEECANYRGTDLDRKHPRGSNQWLCETCKRWCWRNDMCNLFVARPNSNGEVP